jgi:phytoene dehydrogenase-like protein
VRDFLTFDYLPLKDRMKLSAKIGSVMVKAGTGTDYSKQSVYDCLPDGLSQETLAFANTFSMFMSGRGMKETSVQRMVAGASVVAENRLTQEDFEAIVRGEAFMEEPQDEDENEAENEAENEKEKDQKDGKGKKDGKRKKDGQGKKDSSGKKDDKKDDKKDGKKSKQKDEKNEKGRPKKSKPKKSLLTAAKKMLIHKGGFSTQGYPMGGIQSILDCALKSMPAGATFQTDAQVQAILTEKNKAVGVATDEHEYTGDLIIYTGFASSLPQLMELPTSYVNQVNGIHHTVSLSLWIGLDEMRPEFDYIGSEVQFDGMPYWGGPISNYDPALAPKGCQSVGFAFIPQSRDDMDANIQEAYNELFTLLPKIEKHVVMRHEQITIPEKAAITINGEFADIRSPIKNLYLAGTDTDRRSMGVTRAAHSVVELLKALHEDGLLRRQNDFRGYDFNRIYLPPKK